MPCAQKSEGGVVAFDVVVIECGAGEPTHRLAGWSLVGLPAQVNAIRRSPDKGLAQRARINA